MKKIVKIFVMALVIGFCGTLTSSAPINESETKTEEICLKEDFKVENEGIVCTIRDAESGTVIGRCWFCNCADFAEQIVKLK